MTDIPLKPKNEKFTDTQWQALFDEGDNLLVSASAGSGKTTVLVRRVIEKLKSGSNIDELLIVTFTESAAKEMKDRIQAELQQAINQESDNERRNHFVRQLTLLPQAQISTLHAFCLSVIRRFYFLIDIDPVFRLLSDDTERILLQEEVWEEVRDQYFEEEDPIFFKLAENFSNDRSDEGLTDMVLSLYRFAQANPDPKQWLKNLSQNYDTSQGLAGNTLYQQQVKPALLENIYLAISQQEAALEQALDPLMEKAQAVLQHDLAASRQILTYLKNDELTTLSQLLQNLSFDSYPAYRKIEEKAVSVPIKTLRDQAKSLINKIKDSFSLSEEKMLAIMDHARPLVDKMSELTLTFTAAFQKRKLAKGVLDFNDLEHFALEILQGEGQGSEASAYYRQRFEEVLIDEYQDTNRLQEAILYWVRQVAKNNGNFFMVGDVKQSIYAFRLADPTLFVDKYLAFEKEEGGRRILLSENFRSRKEVLEFTNLVFKQLMDEKVGQIPYDQAAQLIAAFPDFPASDCFDTELLLYEKEGDSQEKPIDNKTEGELQLVALKIRELIDHKFQIYDKQKKENRSIEYKDIVLLVPTRSNNLTIMDIFKRYFIPLEVNDAQNYFQATEIQTMLALLEIIDNPYQDIPFVAVLRSPIVGLNEEELAQIRLQQKEDDYYTAFLKYLNSATDPLSDRLQEFHRQLKKWRQLARRRTISTLIWSIYQETAYLDYVLALPSGQQRYANLIALANRAESYEKSSFRGLYQFIRFIEKMQEKDKDLAQPLALSQENAVKVMTIHASKGLEFPVVFLLDMTKQFNTSDLNQRYIFEERLGAGIKWIDEENVRYETLPYQAIFEQRLQKMLSEEMRKLYVALTRAEQKLYLVGSYKSKAKAYKKWHEALDQKETVLNPALRMTVRGNLMDWIGMTLVRHPDMAQFDDDLETRQKTIYHPVHFQIHWTNQDQLIEKSQKIALAAIEENKSESNITSDISSLQQRLNFSYPLLKSTMTTSYQSVSEMKRLYNDPDDEAISKIEWESVVEKGQKQYFRYTENELAKPQFMQEERIDPRLVGSSIHLLLQTLPLTQVPTLTLLRQKVKELIKNGIIEKKIAEKMDLSAVRWFFETDLGELLLTDAKNVKREQPFSMLKDARDIFLDFDEADAQLLIHGIIDGYIEYEDSVILYDFKTDAVYDQKSKEKVIQNYSGQLRLYKEALTQALKKPVTKTYLVLLNTKEIVEMF